MKKRRAGRGRNGSRPARGRSKKRQPGPSTRLTKWLTQAGYARHRGVSKEAVSKAVRQGRIQVGPGGRIDPVAADVAWARSTAPRPGAESGGYSAAGVGPPVDLTEARTMHEYAKAQLAELELGERSGQLVAVADMRDAAFRATRASRDLLLSLPDRLTEVLLGITEAAVMRRLLRQECSRVCDELSSIEPEAESDDQAAEAGA